MRVLHINCNYHATTLHQLLIRQLSELGIKNYVFVPTYDKNTSVIKLDTNVQLVECFKKRDRYWFEYKQRKILSAVESTYDVSAFDMIHAYTLFTDGNCAYYLSKKYNIPYVVAIRNTDVNSFFKYRILLRSQGLKILQDAKAVFFLSKAYRDYLMHNYVPYSMHEDLLLKTQIIPNGIDEFWFNNLFFNRNYIETNSRLCKKEVKLIFAGNIDKNKNVKAIVEALNQLNKSGWHATLEVVGKVVDDSVFQCFKDNKQVNYIPKQPKEELINFYRRNDIFVMPSHHETFGLVYAEAMSQGLPVIYTKGQGFDIQFKEGEVGVSVNSKSISEISKAIEIICTQYERLSKMCLTNVNKFKWNVIASQYKETYQSLVDQLSVEKSY